MRNHEFKKQWLDDELRTPREPDGFTVLYYCTCGEWLWHGDGVSDAEAVLSFNGHLLKGSSGMG